MLSESFTLLKALEKASIDLPVVHHRIKDVAKSGGPCLRIRLSANGNVKDVDEITDEEYTNLWFIKATSDAGFPVVRINEPIVAKDSGTRVHKDGKPWAGARAKAEEVMKATKDVNTNNIVTSFVKHFLQATEDPQDLLNEIENIASDKFKDKRISKKLFEALINGKHDSKKNKIVTKCQLAFDVDGIGTIYTSQIRQQVSHILPIAAKKPKDKQNQISKCCAYTKSKGDLQTSSFPMIPLPIIGKKGFPLVSMFSAAPCNTRYGLTDSAIVPVKQLLASKIFCALRYITSESKRGKTWRGIARGDYRKQGKKKIEKKDLLIVYVDGKPDITSNVADYFGTDQDSVVKQFETDAKTICDTLDGIAKTIPASKLNLFVLRDVSPGQVQVVMSSSFTIKNFIEYAERWQHAFKDNLPEIDLILPPNKKDEKAIIAKPPVLYPEETVKVLSRKYICQGLDRREFKSVTFGEVLDFMFRVEGKWEDVSRKILSLVLYNYIPLLTGIFGAKHSGKKDRFQKYSPQFRKDALRAISILGLTLDANNRTKEVYMKDAAFKIGGFLALADILHKNYCIVVRNNSFPPSLIGNAMMSHTFDNPRLAIADIADRMRVYTGWAKTAKVPDEEGEKKIAVLQAKKILIHYEPLAESLHQLSLPDRCNDEMKAEILLGYLASTKGMDSEINKTEQE